MVPKLWLYTFRFLRPPRGKWSASLKEKEDYDDSVELTAQAVRDANSVRFLLRILSLKPCSLDAIKLKY